MHQISLGGRALPRPTGGAYSTPPDSLAGLRGAYLSGREGEGRRREVEFPHLFNSTLTTDSSDANVNQTEQPTGYKYS